MPKVPISNNVVPLRPEDGPSPTDFAMAAAVMHEEGRLFAPTREVVDAQNSYRAKPGIDTFKVLQDAIKKQTGER